MDYQHAVEAAPAGWRHFTIADLDRLPSWVREHELARVPSAEHELLAAGDRKIRKRVVRALFWTLVYHLEPQMWDALATAEPIHPGLLARLPIAAGPILEIGAGGGRLTAHLAKRSEQVIAVEPSAGLQRLIRMRVPGVCVVTAWAESLPFEDSHFQITAACGVVGPDPTVLRELERVTRSGGDIVLISPEQPEWFVRNGWDRLRFDPLESPPHEKWIDSFFGAPDPPHEMVWKRVVRL